MRLARQTLVQYRSEAVCVRMNRKTDQDQGAACDGQPGLNTASPLLLWRTGAALAFFPQFGAHPRAFDYP